MQSAIDRILSVISFNIFVVHSIMLIGYFKILEMQPTRDLHLIKTTYKRLASRYHPDKNPQNLHWAEEKFKLISEAYRLILEHLNSTINPDFDASQYYQPYAYQAYESQIPNYWDSIRDSADPADQVKMILHELEEENQGAGLLRYDRLAHEMQGVDPLSLLEARHYFDACLLLAEALENAERYSQAVYYYAIYYQHSRILLHKRLFSQEIKKKILRLYKLKIYKKENTIQAIQETQNLLQQVTFSNKEKIQLWIYLTKLYLKVAQYSEAMGTIEKIQKLDPHHKNLETLISKMK